jgi:hypothetical protein
VSAASEVNASVVRMIFAAFARKEGMALLVTYSFYLCALVFLAAGLKK